MSVSDRVRQIEQEIDTSIRNLPIWQSSKSELLADIVNIYRDSYKVIFLTAMHAEIFDGTPEKFSEIFAHEDRLRSGILWLLKWASEYCPDIGLPSSKFSEELMKLIFLGVSYEALVDGLKYAQRNLFTIRVDEESRTIVFYEGGPATAFDSHIVNHQRIINPVTKYVSLTDDSDQLTSRWTAGDYRRVTKRLASHAEAQEKIIFIDSEFLARYGNPDISIPQPTIVWFDRPTHAPDCNVFDDLTLPTTINDSITWRLVSLQDTPIVRVGDKFCGLSSDLRGITTIDDRMLRLAARVDPDQYSVATTLRERRMIHLCRKAFEQCALPWRVSANVLYKNPSQEADFLAQRAGKTIILQLKSTLRPQSPWEVYKRNEALIDGVRHTKSLIDRGAAEQGFVITDGYRGNYSCWAEVLASGIPIATLSDLDAIASDPVAAVEVAKKHVGITDALSGSSEGIADRQTKLMGWTLRFVDRAGPANDCT